MKNKSSRRKFLQTSVVSASAMMLPFSNLASIPGTRDEDTLLTRKNFNMKLGFMSSMAQDKTVPQLIDMAKAYGYQAIEFRPEWKQTHGVELDMTKTQRKEARSRFADNGIIISAISPGVKFNNDDRDQQMEKMVRYIDLATDLGATCIRFFANPLPDDSAQRQESYKIQAEYQAIAAEKALGGRGTACLGDTLQQLWQRYRRDDVFGRIPASLSRELAPCPLP